MDLIEHIHKKNLIYRDIKPDNVLMGVESKSHKVHIVDMGLAKRYINSDTDKHIPFASGK